MESWRFFSQTTEDTLKTTQVSKIFSFLKFKHWLDPLSLSTFEKKTVERISVCLEEGDLVERLCAGQLGYDGPAASPVRVDGPCHDSLQKWHF